MNTQYMSLKDFLKKNTKKQLTDLARRHKMPRYSTYSKNDLVNALGDYLYLEEVLIPFLSYLSQEELHLLSQGESKDSLLCLRLRDAGYCFPDGDGSFLFPKDFPLHLLEDDSFLKEQSKKSFLLDCLECSCALYGAVPYKNVVEMYQRSCEQTLEAEELRAFISDLPNYFCHFSMTDNLIIHQSLMANQLYEKIRLIQGANPYYYPDKEHICHLSRYGYMEDDYVNKLKDYMADSLQASADTVHRSLSLIQAKFRQGGSIKDALDSILGHKELSQEITINREDPAFLSLLNGVFAHSRLLLCRGYTASEKQTQILHPKKIYPNSPCPCGSGKKYKKCCAKLK